MSKAFGGWHFQRNKDGSVGIFAPFPRPGESQRTSCAIYPKINRDLHELMEKLALHYEQAMAEEKSAPQSSSRVWPQVRWETSDGKKFATQEEAEQHEFKAAFAEWIQRAIPLQLQSIKDLEDRLAEHRQQLVWMQQQTPK